MSTDVAGLLLLEIFVVDWIEMVRLVAIPWFPYLFALLQTLRHLVVVIAGYWAHHLIPWARADLAQPLFAPYALCADTARVFGGELSLTYGVDLPAYQAASLLHFLMTGQVSCSAEILAVRCHVIAACLVAPIWFLVGVGMRRMANRRIAASLLCCVLLVSFGPLVLRVAGFSPGIAMRIGGAAVWLLLVGALVVGRLRFSSFYGGRELPR